MWLLTCFELTGKETVHQMFGTRVAVLAGDFMFAQSSWYLANLENIEVIKLISQVSSIIIHLLKRIYLSPAPAKSIFQGSVPGRRMEKHMLGQVNPLSGSQFSRGISLRFCAEILWFTKKSSFSISS
jgi:hypothetical protein